MNKKIIVTIGIIGMALLLQSCNKIYSFFVRRVLAPYRTGQVYNDNEEAKKYSRFYNALSIYESRYEDLEEMLADGIDANYCKGEAGWFDNNPLMMLARSRFHFSYTYRRKNLDFPKEFADEKTIRLLAKYNADFNLYPYLWIHIYDRNDKDYKSLYSQIELGNADEERIAKEMYINDGNRVVRTFLECGADVNKKGHPYPFSYEGIVEKRIKAEEALKYFNSAEATTPLYEAIKKGMGWESQVDLLLQYGAILDDSCLKAAEESGDAAMVEKVKKLLAEINK